MCRAITHIGSLHAGSSSRASGRVMTVELGKLTRWQVLLPRVKPAVEIIKFKEMTDLRFQSGLIRSGSIPQVLRM